MSAWTYPLAIKAVLAHEGGYTNHPADPGGPTNFGITIYDVRRFLKPDASADDVKGLSLDDAMTIYQRHYAAPLRYDDLPAGIDYAVLDYGINSGIWRSAQILQRTVGATTDGIIGPQTLSCIAKHAPAVIIDDVCNERLRFLRSLKTWPVFGKGWATRVEEVRTLAHHFDEQGSANLPPVTPTSPMQVMAKAFENWLRDA